MIEGLPGLIAIGGVATVGFLMARAFNGRSAVRKGSHDSDSGGPAAVDGRAGSAACSVPLTIPRALPTATVAEAIAAAAEVTAEAVGVATSSAVAAQM